MTTPTITSLEKLLGGPRDNALLRYSLGNEWMKCGNPAKAVEFLRKAVDIDPKYSAAWKLYGRALAENGETRAALDAFMQGVAVAEAKGDIQAAKEMSVFAKRMRKQLDEQPPGSCPP